jgi:hypothetical protein
MLASLIERSAVFGALIAAALPRQAAPQHFWRQRDRHLTYHTRSDRHTQFSRPAERFVDPSSVPTFLYCQRESSSNDHCG